MDQRLGNGRRFNRLRRSANRGRDRGLRRRRGHGRGHLDCDEVGLNAHRRSRCLGRRRRRGRRAGKLEAATDSPLAHEIRVQLVRKGDPGYRHARLIAGGHTLALNSSLWRRRGSDLGCIGVHQRIGGRHPHAPIPDKQGGTPRCSRFMQRWPTTFGTR